MKYEIVNTISAATIIEKIPCKEEFIEFVKKFEFQQLNYSQVEWMVEHKTSWINWLVKQGFLKRTERKYYEGTKFLYYGMTDPFILSFIPLKFPEKENWYAVFININTGTRLTTPYHMSGKRDDKGLFLDGDELDIIKERGYNYKIDTLRLVDKER